ncbi:SDR family NAD(P)-dependent oxidoreductase [Nonomuraea rubra]|uniref:NAD(P)-dependent dehydrogenase (Short-subunit alcohol dehydrogenase family) n=1 Tax=Nonomuraea rubra TaxID=46180 RepID=A0A7X0P5V4_9ACTN|nr:SDR family NAD(P)-dependent oxidoreductase [Nonomuraea rubra]MBB6555836.1 NAD(P)-dependent dehydrogenase (short-subunit alcohol dehydrogenase family) [Nonomuraea rubra]
MKTWYITGGTPGGFGMAYANAALEAGDRVVLTTRRPAELSDWAARHPERALVLPVDVTDTRQVQESVAEAESRFGGIDVLVNNAGRGWYGSVEGMSDADVRRTFELNFFSVLAVTRAVLPGMRRRGGGSIINMSSVAGLVGVPGFGIYTAAKFAIEGLTEVLRQEVEPFGIRVLAVEPGAFRTRAYSGFADEPIDEHLTDYQPMLAAVRAAMIEQDGRQPGDPDRGARAVVAAIDQDVLPKRLVLGGAGYDAVAGHLDAMIAELRGQEAIARGADFPRSTGAAVRTGGDVPAG